MKKIDDLHGNGENPVHKKILRIMKLTSLFIIVSVGWVFAEKTYSQTKTLNLKMEQATVKEVLSAIEDQSEFFFMYSGKIIDVDRKVSVNAHNQKIKPVLNTLFAGTDIDYTIRDRIIVLTTPEIFHPESITAIQQPAVSGRVTDESGEPLPGVTVVIKGTNQGTVTNADGEYSLTGIPEDAMLVFSFVGMRSQEVEVGNQTKIDISMLLDVIGLEEVVAVGYGTQRKVNLTGSVSSVSSSEIVKRPAHNVANLLQGKVTGLQITQSSGQPGNEAPLMRIRGLGTFSSTGSDPLVLIDGVQGDLTKLLPESIESISVLKDAASASIYGARAANGVILVTTKQGESGQLNIEYNGNYQIQQPTRMPEFVTNSADFMEYYNYANARNNQRLFFTQEEIDAFRTGTDPIKYPNFNWVDYMIQNGSEQMHNISMSGGTEKTRFRAMFGYVDQKGIIIQDAFGYKKYNGMINVNSKLNKVVTFGTNVLFDYGDITEPAVRPVREVILLIYSAGPNYRPKLSDGSGRWTWRYKNDAWHNRNPEQALNYGSYMNRNYNLAGQAYVDVNITKDLVFHVKGALNGDFNFQKHHEYAIPSYFYKDNSLAALITGYNPGVTDNHNHNILTTIYSTLNYTKSFSSHNINVLGGISREESANRFMQGFKRYFPSDQLTELNAGSAETQSINGNFTEWALRSYFGRLNYDFKGKYLFESNFRYDGTSRIIKDNRWGLFPSLSGAWRISEENFMDQVSWLSNLKLRASWGMLGNQNIGLYPYQDQLDIGSYPFADSPTTSAFVTRLTDKSLKWETTTVTDIGFDLIIKNGLFSLTADWFDKITSDILYSIEIPASIGLSAPTVNYAEMQNTGIEFELGHAHTLGDLRYNVRFNLSAYKNEVLKVKSPSYGTRTIQEGLPWRTHHLVEFIGIFQSQEEIDAAPEHPYDVKPGDLKFRDANGDKVINAEDRVPIDGAFPKFYYGGNVDLIWKDFDLSAFVQGVEGKKIYVSGWGIMPFSQSCAPTIDFVENMWTSDNPTNKHPAMYKNGYGPVTGTASTYFLRDASYIRLKNLTIGYNLPRQLSQRIGMKNLRVYLTGDNLVTLTKYPGADPEWEEGGYGFATYPQIKTYAIGLNVKF